MLEVENVGRMNVGRMNVRLGDTLLKEGDFQIIWVVYFGNGGIFMCMVQRTSEVTRFGGL